MHQHVNFWLLAREVRDYCRDTGLKVLSADDHRAMTIGFVTECDREDSRYRHWYIRVADVSLTANRRDIGYNGHTDAEMIRMSTQLMHSSGRIQVAEMLSTGVIP